MQPGEFHFGGGRVRVRTLLGSCIAIVFWHPTKKVGGMCHFLLPTRGKPRAASAPLDGRYADEAMAMFLREMKQCGTEPSEYVAKLFGGGRMFPEHSRMSSCEMNACTEERRRVCGDVACKNIQAARELLMQRHVNIAAEHVGGVGYRQIIFDLSSGDVWVRRRSKSEAKGAA